MDAFGRHIHQEQRAQSRERRITESRCVWETQARRRHGASARVRRMYCVCAAFVSGWQSTSGGSRSCSPIRHLTLCTWGRRSRNGRRANAANPAIPMDGRNSHCGRLQITRLRAGRTTLGRRSRTRGHRAREVTQRPPKRDARRWIQCRRDERARSRVIQCQRQERRCHRPSRADAENLRRRAHGHPRAERRR